jgi:hypothetical protein
MELSLGQAEASCTLNSLNFNSRIFNGDPQYAFLKDTGIGYNFNAPWEKYYTLELVMI